MNEKIRMGRPTLEGYDNFKNTQVLALLHFNEVSHLVHIVALCLRHISGLAYALAFASDSPRVSGTLDDALRDRQTISIIEEQHIVGMTALSLAGSLIILTRGIYLQISAMGLSSLKFHVIGFPYLELDGVQPFHVVRFHPRL